MMSSAIPNIPSGAPVPANLYPKHPAAAAPAPKPPPSAPAPSPKAAPPPATPEAAGRRHAASATTTTALSAEALSSTDVSYVESLLGAMPAQKMEEILLKTGVPIPANLGPNIDTAA